jgi:hypothetical protein
MTSPVRDALRRWVLERNPCLDPAELRDDTPLLESRLVTSLQVTDLLLLIESLRQAPIDVERLRPGAFRDLATIRETFFDDARSAACR